MGIRGFLKISDIKGESRTAGHKDEIEVFGVDWSVSRRVPQLRGSGRIHSRADVDSLNFQKVFDASSPYLALAAMQGKSFDEVVITVRKDSGDAHLDYLVITMTNVMIVDYQMENEGKDTVDPLICEYVGLAFEKMKISYTVQADDHSAGDEHEVEYDIASGV